ncbi:hypothetical protein PABG_05272 [Paracoccidioides brasiliensis Pb03]|nr:hypothetical protein PABG_05272 [Paracoccidioides brasiliensis Pb03]
MSRLSTDIHKFLRNLAVGQSSYLFANRNVGPSPSADYMVISMLINRSQADWNKPQKYQQSDNCDEPAAPNERSSSSSPSHQVAGLKEKVAKQGGKAA